MKLSIKNSIFKNNSASFTSNYHFGLAITLNKILPVDSVVIYNCTFLNHLSDAISSISHNMLNLISLSYLEYFGFTYTTSATLNLKFPYYQSFVSNFTVTYCTFTNNYFSISSIKSFDLNTAALISFFTDFATDTGVYSTSKAYANGNTNTPALEYHLYIYNITCQHITTYDGRPLFSLFYNNYVEINNITFLYVYVKDTSVLWGSYGGFITLYIIDNSFDFSYNSYKILISNLSLYNCQGTVININHPLEKNSNGATAGANFVNGALNITDLFIQNHVAGLTPFAFRQINFLYFANVYINTISTYYGVFGYFLVQQAMITDTTKLYLINITAIHITSYLYAGFYLIGLLSAEFHNITLYDINHIFTPAIKSNINIGICLYVSTYMPIISNYSCSSIKISIYQGFSPDSTVVYSLCFFFTDITSIFTKGATSYPSNNFVCQSSSYDYTFDPKSYQLYLGYVKNSKSLSFTGFSISDHSVLYSGIYYYNTKDGIFDNFVINTLQIQSTTGYIVVSLSAQSSLTLSNSVISNNLCSNCYGSIAVADSSLLTVKYTNITDNSAVDATCFLIKGSSLLYLQYSYILRNTATQGSAVMNAALSTLNIYNCLFEENRSYINGLKLVETLLTMHTCEFYRNYADVKSSNIYMSVNSEQSYIWDCIFHNNDGFFNNTSSNSQKGHFLFVNDASLLIEYTSFIGGYSSIGGAIYFSAPSNDLYINECNFINNTADNYGGGLYMSGHIEIDSTNFFNNSCIYKGSNIYIFTSSSLNITNSYLSNTIETSIYVDQQAYIYIYNCEIQGILMNYNPINGIYCNLCSNVTIDTSFIHDFNQTRRSGAGIIVLGSSVGTDYQENDFTILLLINTIIMNCVSSKGSAAYIYGKVNANITSSKFMYNSAIFNRNDDNSGKGGSVYFQCTNLYCYVQLLENNVFEGNLADISGGALHYTDMPIIYLDTSTYYQNNSALYGNNQASYAVSIELYANPPTNLINTLHKSRLLTPSGMTLSYQYDYLTSGSIIEPTIVIKILDEYGQIVSSDSSS